jgi:signal transduction histidine kinase
VPIYETLNFPETIRMPVRLIENLQSATDIIVQPFPSQMSTFIISDKHWLCENLLCLLSNAVKYSDGGTVEIITELLHAQESTHDHAPSLTSAVPSPALQHYHQKQENTAAGIEFIRIIVNDTGIGVSEQMRSVLFSVSSDGLIMYLAA